MRVCIFGAGAVGCHLAARFANAGAAVSLIARGPQLAALRDNGLTLRSTDGTHRHRLPASDDPAAFGPQDLVVSTVKAHALDGAAPGIAALLGPDTKVLFAINGIPFWYLDEMRGAEARSSPIRAMVPRARVLGCVVYSANTVVAPGIVHNDMPTANRFVIASPDAGATEPARLAADLLTRGGAHGVATDDIRTEIWLKARTNAMSGPVACLTGADNKTIAGSAELRPIVLGIAAEADAAAAARGISMRFDPARLRAENYSSHKSSILQDLELGRPMEIDEVAGAVQEAARLAHVPTPVLDHTLALLRMRARMLGLYAG